MEHQREQESKFVMNINPTVEDDTCDFNRDTNLQYIKNENKSEATDRLDDRLDNYYDN